MDSGKLDIQLLGTSFSIQANESADYLQSVYSYYVERVHQVEKSVGGTLEPLKVAIIAGVLLADELKKERSQLQQLSPSEQNEYQALAITKKLIDNLDMVLDDENLG